MNPLGLLIAPVIAAPLSLALVSLTISVARRKGWFDDPSDPRKIHTGDIPRLGGPAMVLSYFVAVAAFCFINPVPFDPRLLVVAGGALVLHIVGLVDDFKTLRARYKFVFQLLAAIAVVLAGYSFDRVYLPFLAEPVELGFVGKIVTVVWIAGMANAINMIDGMDGMAGGISLIAAANFGVLYFALGYQGEAIFALALAAAILGFLFFNFPKASIFMGDSGSLFLGFLLACLPLIGTAAKPAALGLFPAATILAVPIFDVFAAIIRRRRRGDRVMSADREHLHHKLMDLGMSTRQILAIVYTVCLGLGGAAVLTVLGGEALQFYAALGALALLAAGFSLLHFVKERAKSQGRDHGASTS